jgi:guanylate kinase
LIRVDVQGANTIKRLVPDAVFIFIAPPSLDALEERLRGRNTETVADLNRRLSHARSEMDSIAICDYVVVNGDGGAGEAARAVHAIVTAEKSRVKRRSHTV